MNQEQINTCNLWMSSKTIHVVEESQAKHLFLPELYEIRAVLTKIVETNKENQSYTIFMDCWSALPTCKLGVVSLKTGEIKAIIHFAQAQNLRGNLCCVARLVSTCCYVQKQLIYLTSYICNLFGRMVNQSLRVSG